MPSSHGLGFELHYSTRRHLRKAGPRRRICPDQQLNRDGRERKQEKFIERNTRGVFTSDSALLLISFASFASFAVNSFFWNYP